MASTAQQGAVSAAPSFTASEWLAQWSDHGGIAILANDRLYLSRSPCVDREAHQTLDRLRQAITARRANGEALAALLIARSFGEIRP